MNMAVKFKMLYSYTVLDLEWLKTHQGTLRIKNLHIDLWSLKLFYLILKGGAGKSSWHIKMASKCVRKLYTCNATMPTSANIQCKVTICDLAIKQYVLLVL